MKINDIELDLDYDSVGKPLRGFSPNVIDDIVQKYYDGGPKIADILHDYDIHVRPNAFVQCLPRVKMGTCRYDKGTMTASLESRSAITGYRGIYNGSDDKRQMYTKSDDRCTQCGHIERPDCQCPHCQARRQRQRAHYQRIQEYQRATIVNAQADTQEISRPQFKDLSVRTRLILGALLRGFSSEDMTYIHSIYSQASPLLPNRHREGKVLDHLVKERVLAIAGNSPLSAFNFADDEISLKSYYPLEINYVLNLDHPFPDEQALIDYLCYPPKKDFLQDADTYFHIQQDLCLEESYVFLKDELDQVNLNAPFHPGARTETVFRHVLDDFSEGQLFYLIHNRVTKAVRYYQEYRVSKKQATNSVITNVERYAEQIIKHGWHVSPYHWPYRLQRSQLSRFFFEYIEP